MTYAVRNSPGTRPLALAVALLCICSGEGVAQQKAQPGTKPLTDLDAARKIAKERDLPIIMAFTGSDWCGYCRMMDKVVFATAEWKEYSRKFVLVTIDIPKNVDLLPEAVLKKNKTLAVQLGVKGFPTYVVLESDGSTVLGKAGARKDINAYAFMKDLGLVLRQRAPEKKRILDSLPAKDRNKYQQLLDGKEKAVAELNAWLEAKPEVNEENRELAARRSDAIDKLELEIQAAEVRAMAREMAGRKAADALAVLAKAKKYTKLAQEMENARADLENWMLGRPEKGVDSKEKLQALTGRLTRAMAALRAAM